MASTKTRYEKELIRNASEARRSGDRVATAAFGDTLRAAGIAMPLCWLPEPQTRYIQPEQRGESDA